MEQIIPLLQQVLDQAEIWVWERYLLYQALMAIAAILVARFLSVILRKRVPLFRMAPEDGTFIEFRSFIYRSQTLLFPLLSFLALAFATQTGQEVLGNTAVIRAAQAIALVILIYRLATHFVPNETFRKLLTGIGLPIALLHAVGWLDPTVAYLDGISIDVGNIQLSLYAIIRTVVFGSILFWLGRLSNTAGQRMIRNSPALDTTTREVVSKLFEIALYVVIFFLLLQVMGIDVSALLVFGGALGVGLGFGLQQIAANFISGLIILLDRSITIGDYIELEDGRQGRLREMNMRSATLQSFDGKELMVPNERFITTAFTNWTHRDTRQRYPLTFSVSYDTDIDRMIEIIKPLIAAHPSVLSGPEYGEEIQPDMEIESFSDSGINILVEFWMEGIDDGRNKVAADLNLVIWRACKAHNISMPFPQREVRILKDSD